MPLPLPVPRTVTLNNGVQMPALGLGAYQLGTGEETERAVLWALQAGYRHIDTAAFYGNEKDVGNAIRKSGIPREEIFVTTKLWPTDYLWAKKAFHKSLTNLGLNYIDLYLVHWPSFGRNKAWRSLENLYEQKLCRAIGVSNYSIAQLKDLQSRSSVVPAVNQVEFSPFMYRKELLEYCVAQGIQLEAYSPLTRGKKLLDPRISTIAQKYGKSEAQIMIRWSLQHGNVVIPKSTSQHRIIENADVFNFTISNEDMHVLDGLHENFRSLFSI